MIKLANLITGDNVIGDFSELADSWTIKNPARLGVDVRGNQASIMMAELSPFLKSDEITISKQHIMYVGEPEGEIIQGYNERFGSGLVLPPSGIKIIE